MKLWKGQAMTVVGGGFIILAVAALVTYGLSGKRIDEPGIFLLFVIGLLAMIAGLTFCALGYVHWVPKWERDEKRTGQVLGE